MVMQAQVGGSHAALLQFIETLRPLPASCGYGNREPVLERSEPVVERSEPVVSLRSTTG